MRISIRQAAAGPIEIQNANSAGGHPMIHSNRYNSNLSTEISGRHARALLFALMIVGALSFVLTLGTANAQSSGRFNVQQIGDALTSYGKNTVNNNGHIYYSVTCGHDSWKSSV